MPIYEYECSNCGKTTTALQKINDTPPSVCEWCKKEGTLHKKMSHSSFILKGGGWFKDCYPDAKSTGTSPEEHHSSTTKNENACCSCPHTDCPSNKTKDTTSSDSSTSTSKT